MLTNYKKLDNGVIRQEKFLNEKCTYDLTYIKNSYDSVKYKEGSARMGYLRLGYLLGAINETPKTLLDVGYGNGDFLNAASKNIASCYGFEINEYPIPKDCEAVTDIYKAAYDVVCFFDVLEHFDDIYEISELKARYVYVSLPECHYLSDTWFETWKHRKPDEHLWHFNKQSLANFMAEVGYKTIAMSNVEDTLRKGDGQTSNILTGLFKAL
jgi:hypothetical protein